MDAKARDPVYMRDIFSIIYPLFLRVRESCMPVGEISPGTPYEIHEAEFSGLKVGVQSTVEL